MAVSQSTPYLRPYLSEVASYLRLPTLFLFKHRRQRAEATYMPVKSIQ